MNLQTVKPRARLVAPQDGNLPALWRVTHPDTDLHVLTSRPHQGALVLLRHAVLPRMLEGAAKC